MLSERKQQFLLILLLLICFSSSFDENDCIQIEEDCCVTEPRTFENDCKQVYYYFDAYQYNIIGINTTTWLPVRRRYKFGPMFFQKPGFGFKKFYAKIYFKNEIEFSTNKECMVYSNEALQYVDCYDKYSHLCLYEQTFSSSSYSELDFSSNFTTCFCEIMNNGKYVLSEENKETENYNCEINYTAYNTTDVLLRLPDINGLSVYYEEHYHSNYGGNSTCRLRRQDVPKADMILTFDAKMKKLILTVYSPEGILNVDRNPIYCFTDAKDVIEDQVKLKPIMIKFSNNLPINKHIYEVELEEYIGNYWCEAYQLPSLTLIKSNKALAFKKDGEEAVLKLIYQNTSLENCTHDPMMVLNDNIIEIYKKYYDNKGRKIRLMEVVDVTEENCTIDFIVHVTITDQSHDFLNEFKTFQNVFNRIDNLGKLNLTNNSNALYCEKEYDGKLTWPKTRIGRSTTPVELCIDKDGLPARRLCAGNFIHGARWLEAENFICSTTYISPQTQQLHDITSQNMTTDLAQEVAQISTQTANSTALDIEYFNKAVSKMFELRENVFEYVDYIVEIVDNVMETAADVLKQSQLLFNAADSILHISEEAYKDTEVLKNATLFKIKKQNFLVQITKPSLSNVWGVALYGTNIKNLQIVSLNSTDKLPDFTDGFFIAMRFQNDSFITTDNTTDSNNLSIIVTVYFQDKLFVDSKNVDGWIVSVVVPEYDAYLRKPVTVWFRSKDTKGSCSFWDYGNMFQRKSGSWSDVGGTYIQSLANKSVVECEYSHLTPFAYLVLTHSLPVNQNNISNNDYFPESKLHYDYLNIITYTGTFLSIFGITIIFLSAVLFSNWRVMIGTKILLQLSAVVLLEQILTQIAGLEEPATNSTICTTIGILLHYTVCSKFCWMLVFAILQYSRFVTVLTPRTNHLLLKAVFIGWCLPLLPIVIVISVSLESYSAGQFMFCYPKGLALTLGLFMPIILILLANLVVFILIMYSVGRATHKLQQQMVLAILLFFVLGMPWLFGIFVEVFVNTWFHYICAYMFCITATLQGFILFVFYVLLNEEVRLKWRYLFSKKEKCVKSYSSENVILDK